MYNYNAKQHVFYYVFYEKVNIANSDQSHYSYRQTGTLEYTRGGIMCLGTGINDFTDFRPKEV